jgi:hypothetical protein
MGTRSGLARLLLITLVLLPLFAIPLFLIGGRVADALDDDASNGVFALDFLLGVGGPGVLATIVTRRRVGIPVAVGLGVASGAVSLAVLFVAFLIYCSAVDCIV